MHHVGHFRLIDCFAVVQCTGTLLAFCCAVMAAYNKVQPISKSKQESSECSKGHGEVTSVSDTRWNSLHSF